MNNTFISTEIAARLEGISVRAIQKRISAGYYPGWGIRKLSKKTGGKQFEIDINVLSEDARHNISSYPLEPTTPPPFNKGGTEGGSRKKRSDAGNTKTDENLILRCAAHINNVTVSSHKRLHRSFGYHEVYNKTYIPACKESGKKIVSYRQFINLTKGFVDKEVQYYKNLGQVRYKQQRMLRHHHDYSVYEPMEFIQNDHTQFDVLCIKDGKIIRPWASFHNSLGDRSLSYPTVVERPDSYSLADDLANFVLRYGLSQRAVRYYSDNGKAQKSRLITKNEIIDQPLKPFNIDDKHLEVMKLMGMGFMSEKGMIQNLGMIEEHSEARQPQQKLIERNFGIGGTMEWFKDRPEYTGRKYEEKPERLARIIKSGNIWSAEEMIDFVIGKVDEYNNRTHQGIKKECKGTFAVPHTYDVDLQFFQSNLRVLKAFQGVVPDSMPDVYRIFNDAEFAKDVLHTNIYSPMWRRRIYELCGWMSRALPGKETLAMMAMKSEPRTVHSYGININNLRYVNIKLQPFIEKKVVVRYSPSNIVRIREESGKERLFINEIYVFKKVRNIIGGREVLKEEFICIAEPHPATIKGPVAAGRTKVFLNERNRQLQEVREADKISTQYSEDRSQESEVSTPIIQLNSFRDEGAKKLNAAIKEKKKLVISKRIEDKMLEEDLSDIYGTTLKINKEGE